MKCYTEGSGDAPAIAGKVFELYRGNREESGRKGFGEKLVSLMNTHGYELAWQRIENIGVNKQLVTTLFTREKEKIMVMYERTMFSRRYIRKLMVCTCGEEDHC